jgi:hypothetical protein
MKSPNKDATGCLVEVIYLKNCAFFTLLPSLPCCFAFLVASPFAAQRIKMF